MIPYLFILCVCVGFTHALFCASGPCAHNGTCYETQSGSLCACQIGYRGQTCTVSDQQCTLQPKRLTQERDRIYITTGDAKMQGYSVSMSFDGERVAVGGPGSDGGIGAVWTYQRNSVRAWVPMYAYDPTGKIVAPGSIGPGQQGSAVALSADGLTLAIGAPLDNSNIGAVYIYTWESTAWAFASKLTVTNNNGMSMFGSSMAISGDGTFLVVGGPTDGTAAGAVWVFVLSSDGVTWTNTAKLTQNGVSGLPKFGSSVAMTPDTTVLVVGGPADSNNKGTSWILVRDGNTFIVKQQDFLGAGGQWGKTVSVSANGRLVVIGGPFFDTFQGGTYRFLRSTDLNTWVDDVFFTVPVSRGLSAALSADGTSLLVGGNGFVELWSLKQGGWSQDAISIGDDVVDAQQLGFSVSMSGDGRNMIAGAAATSLSSGSAIIFSTGPCRNGGHCFDTDDNAYICTCPPSHSGTSCEVYNGACNIPGGTICGSGQSCLDMYSDAPTTQYFTKLQPVTAGGTGQSNTVAIDKDGLTLVTSPGFSISSGPGGYNPILDQDYNGLSYVYQLDSLNSTVAYRIVQSLNGTNKATPTNQGKCTKLSANGNVLVITSSLDTGIKGHVWIFERSNVHSPFALVQDVIGSTFALLGSSCAVSGTGQTIVFRDGINSISVYKRSPNNSSAVWRQTADSTIFPPVLPGGSSSIFGTSVAINYKADIIAGSDLNFGTGPAYTGAMHVYKLVSGLFSCIQSFVYSQANKDYGYSIDMNAAGDVIVVGVRKMNGATIGGIVIYTSRDLQTWVENQLIIGNGNPSDAQGTSVTIDAMGTYIVVGAAGAYGVPNGEQDGCAFVYERNAIQNSWSQIAILVGEDNTLVSANSQFGNNVYIAAGGTKVVVAAPTYGEFHDVGATWVFSKTHATVCQCPDGFSGTECTDHDNCFNRPCGNGATCINIHVNDTYECMCAPGYSGSNCQTQVNECLSLPCHNGGTCSDHVNGFSCFCTLGYTGSVCQSLISQAAQYIIDQAMSGEAPYASVTSEPQCDCGVTWQQVNIVSDTPANLTTGATVLMYGSVAYIPVNTVNQAKFMCYSNIYCAGVLFYEPVGSPPIAYLIKYAATDLLPTADPPTGSVPTSVNFNRVTLYTIMRFEMPRLDFPGLYSCPSFKLDVYYYYFVNMQSQQQLEDPSYCPYYDAQYTPPCCWTQRVNGGCPTKLSSPPGSIDTSAKWVQSAIAHWSQRGHTKRMQPNANCVLTPTAWDASSSSNCNNPRTGCFVTNGLPCGGHGVCKSNNMAGPFYTQFPYVCDCANFQGILDDVDIYIGKSCQYDVRDFCTSPTNRNDLCNENTDRCLPQALVVPNGQPADYRPACNCESPSQLSTYGPYCELSRCGQNNCQRPAPDGQPGDGICEKVNSNCVTNCQWHCTCGADTTGDLCQYDAATCHKPASSLKCQNNGACLPPNLDSALYPLAAYPNYAANNAFCACRANYSYGQYCENLLCDPAVVTYGRGLCNSDRTFNRCYAPYTDSGIQGRPHCDVDKCAKYGGVVIGNPPSDCDCGVYYHGTPPGYTLDSNDITCYPKCPSYQGVLCGPNDGSHAPLCEQGEVNGIRYAHCKCDSDGYINIPAPTASPNNPASWSLPSNKPHEVCEPFCLHGSKTGNFQESCNVGCVSGSFGCSCQCSGSGSTCTTSTNLCSCANTGFNTLNSHPRCDNVICQNGGTWSTNTQSCVCSGPYTSGSNCVTNTCDNAATASFVEGTVVNNVCACNPPYTNNNASLFNCNSNLCGPFGTVVTGLTSSTPANLMCTCTTSTVQTVCYDSTGRNCDFCSVPTCVNGGIIVTNNIARTATCQCPFPYTGTTCSSHLCGQYGSPTTNQCICNHAWTGLTCQNHPCLNNGVWNSGTNACNCTAAYTGTLCSTLRTSSSSSSSTGTFVASSTGQTSQSYSSSSTASHSNSSTGGVYHSSSSTGVTAASASPTTSTSSVLSTGAVAGIAVGSTVAASAIVFGVWWFVAKKTAASALVSSSAAAVASVAGVSTSVEMRSVDRHAEYTQKDYDPVYTGDSE